MQYDVKTPDEYMDKLGPDWRRRTLEELRALIKSAAPRLEEGINYKMLSYSDARGAVFHLNAQKSYVSLYVGDAGKIDTDGTLLAGLSVGKGCIRFSKSVNPADTGIAAFIERTVALRDQGEDIGC